MGSREKHFLQSSGSISFILLNEFNLMFYLEFVTNASFRLDRKNYFYVSTFLHFYVSTEKVSSHYNFP